MRTRVRALFEDHNGVLWVGTYNGIDRFDRQTRTFTHYRHDPADPVSLSENTLYAIHEDRTGRLWVGTGGGLDVLGRATGKFLHYNHDPANPGSLNSSSIGTIYEDATGKLWIGTNGGLHRYDRAQDQFDQFVRYIVATLLVAIPLSVTTYQAVDHSLENRAAIQDATVWLAGTTHSIVAVDVRDKLIVATIEGYGDLNPLRELADQLAVTLERPVIVTLRVMPTQVEPSGGTTE